MSESKHEHFQPIVIHMHPVVLDDETAKFFPALQAAREACTESPGIKMPDDVAADIFRCFRNREHTPKRFKPLDRMQTKSGG